MAKVIKSTEGPAPLEEGVEPSYTQEIRTRRAGNIQKKDTIEARSEKHKILAEAHSARDEIMRVASEEAEDLKRQAHAQGYEEGKAAASEEVQQLIAAITAKFRKMEAQIEPQLRELAITIARKILGKELEFHPDAVVDIVKQALSDKARQRQEVYLRVNPADYQMIRDHKADLIEVLSRCKEIGIREDPDVERHGVVIETDAGSIDAQLETQLAIFERVLMDVSMTGQE
ncbi:MAG: FliH/SctL family protein [Myxococcota bacterium]